MLVSRQQMPTRWILIRNFSQDSDLNLYRDGENAIVDSILTDESLST